MQTWKWSAALLLVFITMLSATLACSIEDALFGMATPTPWPTSLSDVMQATIEAGFQTAFPHPNDISGNLPLVGYHLADMETGWTSDPDQLSNLYTSGFAPTTPFSQLFGNMDQVATIKALKSAIPDLNFTPRMIIAQNGWEALSFDLSGQFTLPLVTANGTLPPTNQPWFTTVQMLVHFNQDGKIDQEYSSADMVDMMHEAGVAGYENVKVGGVVMDKPMTPIAPSTDPAASAAAEKLMNAVGNGPFSIWLPSDVTKGFFTTDVTYHSPYGDGTNDVPEVEHKLMLIASEPVEVPAIVRQGNLIGMAYTYTGSVDYPVKFADGTTLPANHQAVQFSGVVLGQVDAKGNGEAWVMFNRLDNPITTDKFPVPGATVQAGAPAAQATLPAPGATSTPAAEETTLEPTPSAGASATCGLSAPQKVNLRKGPGTSFAVAGTLAAGQSVNADGQAQGSDGQTWFHIASMNLWARSNVVTGDCGSLPEVGAGS